MRAAAQVLAARVAAAADQVGRDRAQLGGLHPLEAHAAEGGVMSVQRKAS